MPAIAAFEDFVQHLSRAERPVGRARRRRGAGRLACCFTCGTATSCTRWEGTARGFFSRRKKNEPPAITAMSTIPATPENASRRFLVGREAVGSARRGGAWGSVAGLAATARAGI